MITSSVLAPAVRTTVEDLLSRTTAHDGVAPLDEAARLSLAGDSAQHLLLTADVTDPVDGADRARALIGYANLLPDGTVQGMVDPAHRRAGHGTALLRAALAARPDAGVWAHGALDGALALLTGEGLVETRRLLTLHRPLGEAAPLPAPRPSDLPGLQLGPFDAQRDAEDWVRVNAAAFAAHPEQGAMTLEDLRLRLAEPWFDAEDLLVARQDGRMVGFVWVKREDRSAGADAEIYVVGTDPSVQGHGVAGHLLGASLARLAATGAGGVELYVEADNTAALSLYERWGFTVAGRDVQLRARAEAPGSAGTGGA